MDIEVPKQPEMTLMAKANFASEVACKALIDTAKSLGAIEYKPDGLMYLPDQAITRQFQLACRAVLACLGCEMDQPQSTPVTRADRDNLIALIGANLNDQSVGSDDIADALIAAGWRKGAK